MRKTTINLALLAAFALGGGSSLFAQSMDGTSNANGPSADPPAGARLPASPGSPQSSGDTSSTDLGADEATSAAAQSDQPHAPATAASQSGSDSTSSNTQQRVQSQESVRSHADAGTSPATGRTAADRPSGSDSMSGRTGDRMHDMGEGQDPQADAARIEAWRRWHERMAQRHMPGARGGDYDDMGDRWGAGDYYDRAPRYRSGDEDYYDRRHWRGPRYGRSFDERYGYRDDPYGQRRYDERRYGRGPGAYDEDHWSARRDWAPRDRWSDRRDWRGDMQGFRDDRRGWDEWRGGRWHGDRWGEGTADRYERYPGQSRGQDMDDMSGRRWDYPDPYRGERDSSMSGERWQDDGMSSRSGR